MGSMCGVSKKQEENDDVHRSRVRPQEATQQSPVVNINYHYNRKRKKLWSK